MALERRPVRSPRRIGCSRRTCPSEAGTSERFRGCGYAHKVRAYAEIVGSSLAVSSWASSPGRRRNMQANRSQNTKPELEVRRALHRLGLRYRVGIAPESSLRRRADIVFTRTRIAVFIDGCFWHGCPVHGRSSFNHNAEYWPAKIAANVARDADTNAQLVQAGWRVLRYWEHENADEVATAIQRAVCSATPRF